MSRTSIAIDSNAKRAVIIGAGGVIVAMTLLICIWALGSLISTRIDSAEVADLAVSLAPDDPQTHYARALFYEGTFEPDAASAAHHALKTAASILPNSYSLWLAVGRLREASGDRAGAEVALRRASYLAPKYSRVRWALGNLLLRNGDADGAFAEMRLAAAGDPKYAPPLVVAARQTYGDDVNAVRSALGSVPSALAALSNILASDKRFDEALSVWNSLSIEEAAKSAEAGKQLQVKFLEGKRFADAVTLANQTGELPFTVGQLYNGGFESAITTQSAQPFEWQVADGVQPQVALTDGQKRSGDLSLLVIFRPTPGKEFRSVSQTVAVVPGAAYHFEAHYRSDIRTAAKIRWDIISAFDSSPIAATQPIAAATDWTKLETQFIVPENTDGIVIRLAREDCALPACSVAGNLWLDDLVLTRR